MREDGGTVDVINLREVGINGNSHWLMHDNGAIADVIHKWLVGKGLAE